MKNLMTLFSALFYFAFAAKSQETVTYQKPPQEILDLVDIERAPSVIMDNKKQTLVYLYSPTYKTIDEVAETELKLAGQRINPKTNLISGARYSTKMAIQYNRSGAINEVKGFPAGAKIVNITWSPNENYIACGNTTNAGVELWVVDVKTATAKKWSSYYLNGNIGSMFTWFSDSKSVLAHVLPSTKPEYINALTTVPSGPSVSVSDGTVGQNRTYPDLLKSQIDERNFELMSTSELVKIDLSGSTSIWKTADLHISENFSPDGNYVLITTMKKPFSYVVPWYQFAQNVSVYDLQGKLVQTIENSPILDNLPKGFMAVEKGKRSISWRLDEPSTLVYVVALDGGDPAVKVENRDEVFTWKAPFALGTAASFVKCPQRFGQLIWGNATTCILIDRWYNTRNVKTYLLNPSESNKTLTVLFDRSSQDIYSDPGTFQTVKNQYNRNVLQLEGSSAYLIGDGFTPQGQFPFVNEYNLKSKTVKNLYRSAYTDKVEFIAALVDVKSGELLVRIESPSEYPNYYVRKMTGKALPLAITSFTNPFKALEGVQKSVITYKRADGLDLSATLYLPKNYKKGSGEKLPMIMWAYPQEFKDKSSASQVSTNPNEFIFPNYGSPIYWVTRGYAILDDAAFPIVGEGKTEPNDSFLDQLVSNAKAAIDAVDAMGVIDRKKVAVGGHSYGAFMTANLLTHSDLFAAGIARSGAYNRTLTPFGFQGEERSFWEAPETYNTMSPFNYADKMKTPLLLVHGENDNNPGTFPIQSERYFQALKGFGAPVRYLVLPKESHGYGAKESILHLLWEQDQWLEKYLKN